MNDGSKTAVSALGVILAGGQNRRYDGRPKALESVGGDLIARRAIRALSQATRRVVMVANDRETYASLGLELRPDVRPGLGALGGIYTAVRWAEEAAAPGALVMACDMPFLPSSLLQALLMEAEEADVVAPQSPSRRGLEPLCAYYATRCRRAIEAALDRGDRHVISFFDDVQVRTLPLRRVQEFGDPDQLFLNVNTPEERERAEAIARRSEAKAHDE